MSKRLGKYDSERYSAGTSVPRRDAAEIQNAAPSGVRERMANAAARVYSYICQMHPLHLGGQILVLST